MAFFTQLYFPIYVLYSHLRNRYRLNFEFYEVFLLIRLLFFNVFAITNIS
jgi:hypothetical protein